MEREGKEVK